MNSFGLAGSRRAVAAASMLVVSVFAAFLLIVPKADAISSPLDCKGSAIQYGLPPIEPVVANPNYSPCVNDFSAGGGGIIQPGLVITGSREAQTTSTHFFNVWRASARGTWGAVTVVIDGLVVRATVLEANANASCSGLSGSSRVAGLQVGFFGLPGHALLVNLPLVTFPLHLGLPNGVSLDLNQKVVSGDNLSQRALAFHTPNRDVILGKAEVGNGDCFND